MKKLLIALIVCSNLLCQPVYSGVTFDGTLDRFISITNDAFNITTGDAMWFFVLKPHTLGESSFGRVFNFSTNDSTTGYSITTQATNTIAISPQGGTSVAASSSSITLDAWNIVVIRKTGTTFKIAVNGVEVANAVGSNPASAAGAVARIGIRNNLQRELDSIVEEFAFWNNDGTDQDVQTLSNSMRKGIALQVLPSALQCYLSLDQCTAGATCATASMFRDISGHGLNFSPSGSPTGSANNKMNYPPQGVQVS